MHAVTISFAASVCSLFVFVFEPAFFLVNFSHMSSHVTSRAHHMAFCVYSARPEPNFAPESRENKERKVWKMAAKAYVVSMTVTELKEELKQRGLSTRGSKKSLRDRLEQVGF